jgi:hypothetical protein
MKKKLFFLLFLNCFSAETKKPSNWEKFTILLQDCKKYASENRLTTLSTFFGVPFAVAGFTKLLQNLSKKNENDLYELFTICYSEDINATPSEIQKKIINLLKEEKSNLNRSIAINTITPYIFAYYVSFLFGGTYSELFKLIEKNNTIKLPNNCNKEQIIQYAKDIRYSDETIPYVTLAGIIQLSIITPYIMRLYDTLLFNNYKKIITIEKIESWINKAKNS